MYSITLKGLGLFPPAITARVELLMLITSFLVVLKSPKSLKVGFALETSNGEKNAKSKLESKKLDYIILNYANEENAGFDSNTNHLFLYSKEGYKKEFDLDTKYRLSLDLIKTILIHFTLLLACA